MKRISLRTFVMIQLIVTFTGIEYASWTHGPIQVCSVAIVIVWVLGTTMWSRKDIAHQGIGTNSLFDTARIALPLALGLGAFMVLVAQLCGTLHLGSSPSHLFKIYLPFALLQEYGMLIYVLPRIEILLGPHKKLLSVCATAGLFSLFHVPNLALMSATFPLGIVLATIFQKHRNMYPLAAAHALLGIAFMCAVPKNVHHSMSFGRKYIAYKP